MEPKWGSTLNEARVPVLSAAILEMGLIKPKALEALPKKCSFAHFEAKEMLRTKKLTLGDFFFDFWFASWKS